MEGDGNDTMLFPEQVLFLSQSLFDSTERDINFVLIFTQKKEIEVKIQNISDKRIF